MDNLVIINQVLILFVIMIIGFLARKKESRRSELFDLLLFSRSYLSN